MKKNNKRPYYRKLYRDLIEDVCPEKKNLCDSYLEKDNWTALDVIAVNNILFESEKNKDDISKGQKHRSYDVTSIKKILNEQLEYNFNNTQISKKYKISRNTITKWKTIFQDFN